MNQKTKKASRNNSKVTYLLSGLIACGECGMSFAGDRAPARGNRKERIVYRCIGEKKNKTCKNKAIRQDVVEQIVIYELDRILSNEGIVNMIDMALSTSFNDSIKNKLEQLEMKKSDLTSKIEFHKIELGKIILPPKEFLKVLFKNDINIKEKSPEEQKRIIKTYVQKVLVFPDYIEIYTDRGLSDGAEGNRTVII